MFAARTLFALFVGLLPIHVLFAQEVARPELNVGDTWTFERTDRTLNKVEDVRESKLMAKSDVEYRYEAKMVSTGRVVSLVQNMDSNTVEFEGRKIAPYMPLYSWPLSVGKKWSGRFGGQNAVGTGPFSEERSCEVVGREKIQVKAGAFDAFKIVCTGNYRNVSQSGQNFGGQTWLTMWHAPEVKRPVEIEYRDANPRGTWNNWVDELVSFELKK